MEYLGGGSALDLMKAGTFAENDIAIILREILNGLHYLHSEKKLHRDIKCETIGCQDSYIHSVESRLGFHFLISFCVTMLLLVILCFKARPNNNVPCPEEMRWGWRCWCRASQWYQEGFACLTGAKQLGVFDVSSCCC